MDLLISVDEFNVIDFAIILYVRVLGTYYHHVIDCSNFNRIQLIFNSSQYDFRSSKYNDMIKNATLMPIKDTKLSLDRRRCNDKVYSLRPTHYLNDFFHQALGLDEAHELELAFFVSCELLSTKRDGNAFR